MNAKLDKLEAQMDALEKQLADGFDDALEESVGKALNNHPNRHRFEAMVDHVADYQEVSKQEAMRLARREYPELYEDYQRHNSPRSYGDLVEEEIGKGFSRDVASQRAALLNAQEERSEASKRKSKGTRYMRLCEMFRKDTGCSRAQAMSEIRKRHPEEFIDFQNA